LPKGKHLFTASKYSDYFCTVDFLFYTTDIRDNLAFFPEEESRHLVMALRRRVNDPISITDGTGYHYQAVIQQADKKACVALILESIWIPPPSPGIYLAVAITKHQDRLEWCLEKAVELGISRFTPFLSKHCERKSIREDRLRKIAVSAMKQSTQYTLPVVDPLMRFDSVVNEAFSGFKGMAYIAEQPATHIAKCLKPGVPAKILIGPEGDFSPEEVSLAQNAGFEIISLGGTRLRTESAAVFATAAFKTINSL